MAENSRENSVGSLTGRLLEILYSALFEFNGVGFQGCFAELSQLSDRLEYRLLEMSTSLDGPIAEVTALVHGFDLDQYCQKSPEDRRDARRFFGLRFCKALKALFIQMSECLPGQEWPDPNKAVTAIEMFENRLHPSHYFKKMRRLADAGSSSFDASELLAVDEALTQLETLDSQKAEVVRLRYFASMSLDEIAEVLGVSPRTVDSEWQFARAWLHRILSAGD